MTPQKWFEQSEFPRKPVADFPESNLDPEARHTHLSTIHQTLIDPDAVNDLNDWSLHLTLDPEKSNEAKTPVLHLENIGPI